MQEDNYLGASLRFLAEDTREGVSLSARDDFNRLREKAASNPDNRDLAEYVGKFDTKTERQMNTPPPEF